MGLRSFQALVSSIDLTMFSLCVMAVFCFLMRFRLPDRSYGGPMPNSTYMAPLPALLLYKAVFWLVGVDVDVGFVWHVVASALLGSLVMFLALAADPEQCGPGIFLAFVFGAGCSLIIPILARMLFESRTAMLMTEAGVPVAVATCWVLGRAMHSD